MLPEAVAGWVRHEDRMPAGALCNGKPSAMTCKRLPCAAVLVYGMQSFRSPFINATGVKTKCFAVCLRNNYYTKRL